MSVVYDAKKVQAMTPAQVAALAPAEFLKFDKGGVSQLQGAKFSTLNIDQITKLHEAGLLKYLPAGNITALRGPFVAKLSGDMLKAMLDGETDKIALSKAMALPADGIKQLSPTQITALTPGVFSAFSPVQAAALSKDHFAVLQADQLKALSPAAIGGISPAGILGVSATLINNLFESYATGTKYTTDVVAAVRNLSPATIQAMTPEQIKGVEARFLSAFTEKQIAALGADDLNGLSAQQLVAFGPGATRALYATVLPGLNGSVLNSLFESDKQGAAYTNEVLSAVRGLSPKAIEALSPAQISKIDARFLSAFTDSQVAALGADDWNAMSAAQRVAFGPSATRALNLNEVAKINGQALNDLLESDKTGAAYGKEIEAAVRGLSPKVIAALTADQLTALDTRFFSVLTNEQVAALSAEDMAAMSPEQLTALPALSTKAISPSAMEGLREGKINLIFESEKQGRDYSNEVTASVQSFSLAAIKVLSADQVVDIDARFLSLMTDGQVAAFGPSAWDAMTRDQLIAFSPRALKGMTPEAMMALTKQDVTALLATTVSGKDAAGIVAQKVMSLSPAVIGELGAEKISGLAPETLKWVTPAQRAALSVAGVLPLSPEQKTALQISDVVLGGVYDDLLKFNGKEDWIDGGTGTDTVQVALTATSVKLVQNRASWDLVNERNATLMSVSKAVDVEGGVIARIYGATPGVAHLESVEKIQLVGLATPASLLLGDGKVGVALI